MARRREVNVFSLSFLDLISGALGAVIILYVAVPKANPLEKKLDEVLKNTQAKDSQIAEMKAELEKLPRYPHRKKPKIRVVKGST